MDKRPDGGWGWVVAVAAFVDNVLVDGVKYSFGIMFVELVETFKSSNSATSWILSIQVGVFCLSGPIVATLVNRYGCRKTVMVGTVFSCTGFIASSFSQSLYVMYLTFGGMAGFGFALMNIPASVTLARYFDKYLAVATGISCMGSGVGTLVFNPVSKILINKYAWRGTLLIEGGFILNGFVIALLLVQPGTRKRGRSITITDENASYLKDTEIEGSPLYPVAMDTEDDYMKKTTCYPLKMTEGTSTKLSSGVIDSEQYTVNGNVLSGGKSQSYNSEDTFIELKSDGIGSDGHDNVKKDTKRWLSLAPLKNIGFILFIVSSILIEFSLNTPFAFLPNMMKGKGYDAQDIVWIMLIIGMMSTISRLVIGFIADLRCINRVVLCNSLVTITGVWIILCPFCFNFESYVAFAVLFGISAGSSNSLRGILIPDLFGVEKIADLFGISLFFSGISAVLGLPVAGALYDATGNYVTPFVVAGIEQFTSGLLLFLIPVALKFFHQ
ncbi:hypothetical protein ACF0H5_021085 [Mactra antiquata]